MTNVCSSAESRSLLGRRQAGGAATKTARSPACGSSTPGVGDLEPGVLARSRCQVDSGKSAVRVVVVHDAQRLARLAAATMTKSTSYVESSGIRIVRPLRGSAGCARPSPSWPPWLGARRRTTRASRRGAKIATPPGRRCAATVSIAARRSSSVRHVRRSRRATRTASNVRPEPERAHVSLHVLALGVERAAELEHLLREVGQRAREARA